MSIFQMRALQLDDVKQLAQVFSLLGQTQDLNQDSLTPEPEFFTFCLKTQVVQNR